MEGGEVPQPPKGSRFLKSFTRYPIAIYITLGFVLQMMRYSASNAAYQKHFSQFDKERLEELQRYMAEGKRPATQEEPKKQE